MNSCFWWSDQQLNHDQTIRISSSVEDFSVESAIYQGLPSFRDIFEKPEAESSDLRQAFPAYYLVVTSIWKD